MDVWVSALNEPSTRDEARMLLLVRAIAVSRAKCILLEATRDERLVARDEQAVRPLTTVRASETKRLTAFLAEHRLGCRTERRGSVTVAVSQMGTVNIAAGVMGWRSRNRVMPDAALVMAPPAAVR